MNFEPGINHKKWQLVLIPVVSALAALLVMSGAGNASSGFYFPWRTFLSVAVFTYVTWQVNLVTYRRLDKRMAFYERPAKRLLAQIALCLLATWATFTALYVLMSVVQSGSATIIFDNNFFLFLLIATAISLSINALYVIRYLQSTVLYKEAISTQKINELLGQLDQKSTSAARSMLTPVPVEEPTSSMLIHSGNKTFPVDFSQMAFWFSSSKLVTLVLKDGKKISTNFSSFAPVLNQLPQHLFFQLNRQFIAHIQSIACVQDEENGKLIVALQPPQKEMVPVSRYRSREFKTWFANMVAAN